MLGTIPVKNRLFSLSGILLHPIETAKLAFDRIQELLIAISNMFHVGVDLGATTERELRKLASICVEYVFMLTILSPYSIFTRYNRSKDYSMRNCNCQDFCIDALAALGITHFHPNENAEMAHMLTCKECQQEKCRLALSDHKVIFETKEFLQNYMDQQLKELMESAKGRWTALVLFCYCRVFEQREKYDPNEPKWKGRTKRSFTNFKVLVGNDIQFDIVENF